ncbi:LysM peptidoglycan-binding domain-containing protein [Nocardia macrotermitis]|uniref:LysM domain-containing protein n=1 Tax=Nocardia macrotermitis TaxID=2585198 RepID=A0A7K0CVY7_9NOCA|nr:LysM peptidoglycan-binding domain-containing protein [Nocardia macrotermitis]MQY17670.1 hypothetical protein [Nocardia macrotermitis]
MRTTISETDVTARDSGYDAALPGHRPRAVAPVRRSTRAGRPRAARPPSGVMRYDRPRVRFAETPHPQDRVEQARIGFATLAVAALLSALAVGGLLGVAQLRAGAVPAPTTTVVQVREGEPLAEVAARVAPGVPVAQTVDRIVRLNALQDAQVAAGGTLIVPTSGR